MPLIIYFLDANEIEDIPTQYSSEYYIYPSNEPKTDDNNSYYEAMINVDEAKEMSGSLFLSQLLLATSDRYNLFLTPPIFIY